jgi:hypothetical protein
MFNIRATWIEGFLERSAKNIIWKKKMLKI